MSLTRSILLWLVVLSLAPLHAEATTPYQNTYFSLSLPVGVRCEAVPGPDFTVYHFTGKGGRQLFAVYAGTAPSFPSMENEPYDTGNEEIGGVKVKVATFVPVEGWKPKEFLFEPKKGKWAQLHAWYRWTSPADMMQAEQIIRTIRQ